MQTGIFPGLGVQAEESGSEWGALGVLGAAILGGALSAEGQEDTNATNLQIARDQMAFQERMSSTAYQRAVDDMKKAGINPMLSTRLGGASSPAGAGTTVQNAMGVGVNTAQQIVGAYQSYTAAESQQAQADLLSAQADKVRSETYALDLNTAFRQAEVDATRELGPQRRAQAAASAAQADKTSWEGITERLRAGAEADGPGSPNAGHGFSADVARRKAEARLRELDIPRAEAEQQFYNAPLGEMSPWVRQLIEVMRGLSSAFGARR